MTFFDYPAKEMYFTLIHFADNERSSNGQYFNANCQWPTLFKEE